MRRAWSLLSAAAVVPLVGCPADPIGLDTDGVDTAATSGTPATTGITTMSVTSGVPSTGSSDGGPATSDSGSGPVATDSSSGGDESTGDPPPPPTCGNNVIEGDEVCDLAQINGETCESLGAEGGVLGCLLDCTDYNMLGCFICGNDIVDMAEDCETVVPKEVTCESLGFPEGGVMACGGDCLWDTSNCQVCGDGIQQGFEDCDGADLGGETCVSLGFDAGNLACAPGACGYDYSDCSGGQYIQDFEAGPPLPLEFTTGGALDWSVDMANPINGTYSATSNDLGEGQNNFMSLDVLFAIDGTIEFLHAEDSEGSFDYLEFYMDGVLQDSWSGNNPPMTYMMVVPAGPHTFQWTYTKDGVVSVGLDRVWVDDIVLFGGVPV